MPRSRGVRLRQHPAALAVRPDLGARRVPPRPAGAGGLPLGAGRALLDHASRLRWPGPGAETVAWLRELRAEWTDALDHLTTADLDRPAAYPWPADAGLTVAHLAAWVNAELMKNVAEIGQLRLLRAAGRPA
ncbi:DinB family protein [Micromonospora tulbaghiae]|uniref:DinB family protein n=1 Tax=Micromonospora tulbaghiae TaxID=479978 RepID=UPI0036B6E0B6